MKLPSSRTTLALAGTGIQRAVQLAMAVLLPRALVPEIYAQLNFVLPIAFFGVYLVFGWFSSASYQHVDELLDPEDSTFRHTVVSYYVAACLLLTVVFALTSTLTSSIFGVVPLLLVASGLKDSIRRILNTSRNQRGYMLANLGFAVPVAVLIALCFSNTDLAQTLTIYAGLDIVVSIVVASTIRLRDIPLAPRFDVRVAKRYFHYGTPFVVNVIALWIISLSDRYLLAIWVPTQAIGSYVLSYQLAANIIMLPMAFLVTVLFPRFLEINKERGRTAAIAYADRLLHGYLRYIAVVFFAACALVLPFKYFFYPAYDFQPGIVVMIIAAQLISSITTLVNKEFELDGRTPIITRGYSLGAGTNIVLNLALIPLFGVTGAAVATMFAYALTVLTIHRARAPRTHPG